MTINENIKKAGIILPKPISPIANYLPFVRAQNRIFISGQLPIADGEVKFVGKLGKNISIEEGQKAAKICVTNIVANLKTACNGNLELVARCIKLGVFINAADDFESHPLVANGASDLMVEIFGEAGKHSRFAVGVGSLPRGASVEIDAIFEIND
ncbi:MAG: enamine deaminase RidA (YjgF/YER057c/UK114 family) [Lentimonas sp.]|jgi:enamine deaminase RidA (YjgF/YER057c/UK114 family)